MEKEISETPHVLRMKEGIGGESYATNSVSQSKYQSESRPMLERAVTALCSTNLPKTIAIADLGCSSGPNALSAISQIISIIHKRRGGAGNPPPEYMVFLNDLPGNDFNSLFLGLPKFREKLKEEIGQEFGPCFIAGIPGSFHRRLFPCNSLHFVHSSSSLHWLSQVPPELSEKAGKLPLMNRGKIFISRTSPAAVIDAYESQFKKDFGCFLRSRSEEMVAGGRMVLTLRGRRDPDPCPDETCLLWDYLAQAFQDLVSEGLIEEEKLDSYNTPYYEPYVDDIKEEIEREGSFVVECVGIIALPWDGVNTEDTRYDRSATARQMAKAIRAVNESMIRTHFGSDIVDPLFRRFTRIMAADTKEVEHVSVVVSLIRKNKIV